MDRRVATASAGGTASQGRWIGEDRAGSEVRLEGEPWGRAIQDHVDVERHERLLDIRIFDGVVKQDRRVKSVCAIVGEFNRDRNRRGERTAPFDQHTLLADQDGAPDGLFEAAEPNGDRQHVLSREFHLQLGLGSENHTSLRIQPPTPARSPAVKGRGDLDRAQIDREQQRRGTGEAEIGPLPAEDRRGIVCPHGEFARVAVIATANEFREFDRCPGFDGT
ncbi:MAG: hypothetical protein IPK67_00575 [Planctomycetes bacterium]|nr:hypothetical protein [Planctomycetota bacterium]